MMTEMEGAVRRFGSRVVVFGHMIRFSHSVFALPFALAGVLFAAHRTGDFPTAGTWFWVVVAMVSARSAAMAVNRIADARLDAANPRTRNREIPTGALGPTAVWGFTLVSVALFIFSCSRLNPLALFLSPLALAIVFFYSFTKRFTWATHMFLGLGLAVAPVGGWVAVTGRLEVVPFVVSLGVLCWVAGFDVFYSIQDLGFDRGHGLHSIPARFGVRGAFIAARILHATAVVALAALYGLLVLSPVYLVGVAVIALVLVYEHSLVRPGDLRRLDKAFFDMNAVVGVIYLLAAVGGVFL